MKDIFIIEFDTYAENSDGEKIMKTGSMAVIFNINIINEEEVNKLIDSGKAKYDERVILVTQKQAKNLFYKKKEKGN